MIIGYRIRNFFIIFALLLASYLVEYSVFAQFKFIGGAPNLMLIMAFCFGYLRNRNAGMTAGFFAGLFVDVFFCEVIGYNALILLFVGFLCGQLGRYYFSDSIYTQILILMICQIACSFVCFFFWYVLQSNFEFVYFIKNVFLPEFILTLLAGLILLRPMASLIKAMYRYSAGNEAEKA